MQKIFTVFVVLVLAAAGIFWYALSGEVPPGATLPGDFKNATYLIDGQSITLVNGRSEIELPESSTKVTTQYFGNEVVGDLNGDGLSDRAFLLTQNTGGSGTFYYVAVALKLMNGYQGTNAILLGDRIAPQTTEIHNGKLVVNYADRAPTEPFSTQPSIGVSKYFKISSTTLSETTSD